jgi:kynurenine formamidase
VLLYSGHSNQFGNDTYYRKYPVIDNSLAEFFCNRQIKIAGMDTPSPDIFPFEIHKILFNQGIFIIENLTNLEKLLSIKQFEVFAFPLKIKADSSPVRVVARYETTDNTPISGEVL